MNADNFVDPEADQSDDQAEAFDEPGFLDWYTRWADTTGIDPNPDDPQHFYDYRAAYDAGDEPTLADDGAYHWPSQHKKDDHPNRFIDGVDTRSGERLPEPEAVEPPIKEAKDGKPEPAAKKPVEVDENDFEPVKEPVEVDEKDFEPAAIEHSFGQYAGMQAEISRRAAPPVEKTPAQLAAEAAQKEVRRMQQEEANTQARPLIDAYFEHMVPDAVRKTDTFYSGAAGAAVDESGVIWDRRRKLALEGKDITPEEQARLEWLDKVSEYATTAEGFFANVGPSAGQLIGQQVNSFFSSEMNPWSTTMAAMAGAAGVAALGGPLSLVTVPAAMTAAGTATMATMQFQRSKAVEGGHAFKEALEWTDEDGKTIDRQTAAVVADIIGSINGALELVGMGAALEAVKGLKGFKGGIRPLLKESAVLRKELIKMARNYTTGVVGETGTEVLQEMPAMAAEAKISGKSVLDALTNEAARLNYEDIAMKVAPGMALLGVGGAAGHAVTIKSSMKQAKNMETLLPVYERGADVIEAGLATGATTQDDLAAYYINAKKVWPDNPVLPRLEAMMAEPPGETGGPSMYAPAAEEDIAGLTTYLTNRLPDGTQIQVEPSTERKGMGEVQRIGDQTGTRVQFFKGEGEADQFNGLYDADTNTIWINESAANPFAVVLGHETLHQMKQEHADLYEQLSEIAKGKELGFAEYLAPLNESRVERGLAALTIEDALAREEFLADFAGDQFKSPEFWDRVNKLNPTLGQKLAQYVTDLIEKIKVAFGAEGGKEYLSDLEQMQDALAKTYVEFARRKGEVQDLTEQTLGQKVVGAIGTALSPGSAEAAAHAGVKAGKASKVVIVNEEDFGPPVAPEAQGEEQAEKAPKDKGEEAASKGAPAGEAKQAEFDRLWGELDAKEQKRLADIPKDDEMSIDEKITFVKAEMAKRTSGQKEEKKVTPVTAYKKEAQDYRKKNEGRVVVPDGLEVAWEHIKAQEAPEWFGPGQWSRNEFDALAAKVDDGKKLTYNENQRFLSLIDVMDDALKNDKELAAKVANQEAADALEEKGWTPVMEERPADSIPDGAQVQIDGKVYKQAGINDDGFVHLKGEEDLLLEPYENVKIEGLKGGKVQKDDIAASLKKNDFDIDVVAMDEQGNTAKIKAKASEAVAENDKQMAFAKRLLECLNS